MYYIMQSVYVWPTKKGSPLKLSLNAKNAIYIAADRPPYFLQFNSLLYNGPATAQWLKGYLLVNAVEGFKNNFGEILVLKEIRKYPKQLNVSDCQLYIALLVHFQIFLILWKNNRLKIRKINKNSVWISFLDDKRFQTAIGFSQSLCINICEIWFNWSF